jgi:methyl-accepting chemotaxis protein
VRNDRYKRVAKGGREIWIQASYNPILDATGRPLKVVKFATDITNQKNAPANFEGQLAAIGKSMAVIEFSLDGRIQTANENFLKTLGYSLEEIRGQHHSLFVAPDERSRRSRSKSRTPSKLALRCGACRD